MTASQAVGKLRSGMTLGIGGWGARRKPMALIREILRSSIKDLTVVGFGGPDVGMLCAAGKVRRLVYGFVSLDFIPLEPYFRKARETGSIEVSELDEGMLVLGLRAAGMGVPFLPTPIGFGTDVLTHNPQLRTVRSPYDDGELLIAMPAIPVDVSLLHVNRADRLGNSQTDGPDPYFDDVLARAADRCFLSTEILVDRLDQLAPDTPRSNLFDRSCVAGVVATPGGAHPTSCPDVYGWDAEHIRAYAASAGEAEGWRRYVEQWITPRESAYQARIGGAERLGRLPLAIP